jgi:FkbM family methyltransferase
MDCDILRLRSNSSVNPWVIKVRSLARRTGIIALINRMRPPGSYEQRVHEALAAAVKPADVVWDVGANVGVYTELFCEWVGERGLVVAFEPFADSCERIRQRLPLSAPVRIENVALGEADTQGRLVTAESSVENHIETDTDTRSGVAGTVSVVICRGDTICDQLGRAPNVIKIDVEGFEEEVLAGMDRTLESPALRSVLVEVHFAKLEGRGRASVPSRLQQLLDGKGFRTRWVDASHLLASR